jgi:hypothetical protein
MGKKSKAFNRKVVWRPTLEHCIQAAADIVASNAAGRFDKLFPESWRCLDCGKNTAPGALDRRQAERQADALGNRWFRGAKLKQAVSPNHECFTVYNKVWKKTKIPQWGGCLCIRLEGRIGRGLKSEDFDPHNGLNMLGGSKRLRDRRGY